LPPPGRLLGLLVPLTVPGHGPGPSTGGPYGEFDPMSIRMRVHDREPIGAALRRFKKLLERSGLKKELRKHEYYEKPCELRRRAMLRKQRAIRKGELGPQT
jgi:small subunit ribosomal protein S21